MSLSRTGQQLNVNADVAARKLAQAVKPLKTIYISSQGGLLDNAGNRIKNIDIGQKEFQELLDEPWFKHGDRLKLLEIEKLIHSVCGCIQMHHVVSPEPQLWLIQQLCGCVE